MKPPHGTSNPTNFHGAPSLQPQRMGQQAARVVEVRVALPVKQTHQTDTRITVRLPDQVELNAEALRRLPIRKGSSVDLIPPRRGASARWLLDTRPTATGRLRVKTGGISFVASCRIDPCFFGAGPGQRRSRRSFRLGPELLEQVCVTIPATEWQAQRQVCEWRGTGVYELLPA